jgi:hypothetical protein
MRIIMMTRRSLFSALAALALVAWVGNVTFAKDDSTHDGTVVSVSAGKLTMTATGASEQHTHTVPADAKVTLDGKDARLTDLKKGDQIKVTMGADKKITKIEATRKTDK